MAAELSTEVACRRLLQLRPIEVYITAVAVTVVDHQVNHPVGIGVRIRIHQDGIDHAEHGRRCARSPEPAKGWRTIANPGFFPNIRNPYRVSSAASRKPLSGPTHPALSPSPILRSQIPAAPRAPLLSSLRLSPRVSRAAISRWLRTSSLSSVSRFFSPPKTHGPPLPFLPSMFITLPAEARPAIASGKLRTIWNVPCSVAFFPVCGQLVNFARCLFSEIRHCAAIHFCFLQPVAAPDKENRYPPAATRRNDSESPR